MEALEQLKSVLCDPEGRVCISGSNEDRRIIQNFIDGYADQLKQAKVEVLREAADELVARGYYMSKRYQAELHRMADEIERSKT